MPLCQQTHEIVLEIVFHESWLRISLVSQSVHFNLRLMHWENALYPLSVKKRCRLLLLPVTFAWLGHGWLGFSWAQCTSLPIRLISPLFIYLGGRMGGRLERRRERYLYQCWLSTHSEFSLCSKHRSEYIQITLLHLCSILHSSQHKCISAISASHEVLCRVGSLYVPLTDGKTNIYTSRSLTQVTQSKSTGSWWSLDGQALYSSFSR